MKSKNVCGLCGRGTLSRAVIPYTSKVSYDGKLITVNVEKMPVLKCDSCNEVLLTNESDDCITEALRKERRLLAPEEIRKRRLELRLTQKQLADMLGAAEATISRWETGGLIQSKAMDRWLRAYFAFPETRMGLELLRDDPSFGLSDVSCVVAEEMSIEMQVYEKHDRTEIGAVAEAFHRKAYPVNRIRHFNDSQVDH